MKRFMTVFAVLSLLAVSASAQDDVYFVPKKKKATPVTVPTTPVSQSGVATTTGAAASDPTAWETDDWYVGRAADVDVDAYNRRYDAADTALVDTTAQYAPYYYEEPEYEPAPTELLVRFHGYYDPWYYSDLAWTYGYGMPWDWYYDPWYYGAWGRHGWHYAYGWASPYYGYWGSPWYSYHPYGWGWHYGWNNYGWHHHYVHFNSDGSRGFQNRGGYRGGTRSTASRGGNAGVNGNRVGALGVNSPAQRGGYVGGNRSSVNGGTTRSSVTSGSRTGSSLGSGSRAGNRSSVTSTSTSRSSRSSYTPSSSSSSTRSTTSSVSGYSGGSRSSSSYSGGGRSSGGFSSGGHSSGGGSRGGRR